VLRLAVRGVLQRKLRAFVTTLSVFLGVSFIAGAFVLTDTINASFDDIFSESLKGTDVTVTPKTENTSDEVQPPAMPASLLDRAEKVDGVEAAEGAIFSLGSFVDRKGDRLGNPFAPNFISSHLSKRFETLTYVEGRPPRNAGEASIDTGTADNAKLRLGGTLRIAGEEAVKDYRIVGETKLGETSFGGAAIAQLILPEAQRITDKREEFDQISIAAAEDVDDEKLKRRVDRAMPNSVLVETGQEAADRQTKEIAEDLSFIKILLLVLGFVALLVGSFLIFNTFSITVAQRIRELGLLRTLGASRRQVLGSMILEASVLGGLGSILGVPGGIGAAIALNALFKTFDIDLPNTGTVIEPRTVIVALLVGMVVTLLSSIVPAVRATRVSPMAALLEAELPEGRGRGKIYTFASLLLMMVGLALTSVGLFGGAESGAAAGLVGGGAVVTLFGVSMFSPRLVRPLASITGRPLEAIGGLSGRLARENAIRKPGRTAVTAGALMIGVAVVVFVTVFAAGISDSVAKAIDRNFQGDVVLQNVDGFSPIPARAGKEAERVDGVETVSSLSFGSGTVRRPKKETLRVSAVDPKKVDRVLSLDWKEGSPDTISSLRRGDAVADDAWASSRGLNVGDQITIRTPKERTARFTIRGTVKDNADLLGHVVVREDVLRSEFGIKAPSMTFIRLEPGADDKAVQKNIAQAIERRYPTVEVLNQKELKDKQEDQIMQLVALLYALLAMAVIVSILGIVTTLALSIHERTRELGMLRAVGMSRRQVRRMVRYESVITALIGAILGMVLGIVFAALIAQPLADEGFTLAYPIPILVILLILAALAGVLAAIGPARRASRLNVLEALAYE
jgi:putative ABC transport system permease protein